MPAETTATNSLLPLQVRGLTLTRGPSTLLDAIDLDVASAGITLIMGPNGAGKSLLIRLLHGLEDPTAGQISWAGQPMSKAIRKHQAMVFQRPVLLRRTVAANIDFVLRLGHRQASENRTEVLRRVALEGRERTPARLLSGGEQQRLALARALVNRPRILFLDEPTASLDPASTSIIEDIVREESRAGTKVIFVTHDVGQARRLGDDVIFLHHGRVAETGDAKQVFETPRSTAVRDYLAGRLLLT